MIHLIYNLGVGGTEKMLLNTLPRLSDFRHLVCVINSVSPLISGELEAKGITVVRLKGAKIFHFRKIIKEEKPDLMITYLIYADLFGRIFGRIFKVKKIITSIRSTYNEPKYKFWLFWEKITSGMIDKYIAVSQTVKDIYSKELGIPETKIEVIYNGVDIAEYGKGTNKEQKKKELGVPEENFVLGSVGKWRPEKGQIYLIRALPEIIKKFPNVTLLLVGGGEDKEKLANLAESIGAEKNLLLLEERADIPEILKTFDVFLNPSLYEGMSNSILEAMATKIPIVASDIPSNAEIIENKKSGLLVPVMDSGKIAEAVIEILSTPDLGKNLVDAAFEKVQNFSIEKTVEKLNQFLRQVI